MKLKMVKLPKQWDHFPTALMIRGNPWSRRLVTSVYTQAQQEESKVNEWGLYQAIIVKKEYPKKPGYVAGTMYGVYIRAKKPRKVK